MAIRVLAGVPVTVSVGVARVALLLDSNAVTRYVLPEVIENEPDDTFADAVPAFAATELADGGALTVNPPEMLAWAAAEMSVSPP